MIPADFDHKDSRQYRFPRQCPGFQPAPNPESAPWVKAALWIVGIGFIATFFMG